MEKDNKKVSSQVISGLLKSLKIILLFVFSASLLILVHLFLMPNTCKKDFKAYPEKGYCEFNLKICEGLFGCKEYENERVPCGSVSTLCGEKVLCDCGDDNNEPLTYSSQGIGVVKEERSFSYTSEQLKIMSEECGVEHDEAYFDSLVAEFTNSKEIRYSFNYEEKYQDTKAFTVTLLPNKAEYSSLEEFKNDFDLCAAGGDLYPLKLNEDWLLFVNSCGSGGSDVDLSCDELRKIVEPSLILN